MPHGRGSDSAAICGERDPFAKRPDSGEGHISRQRVRDAAFSTDRELDDMVFGWAVEQGVTSNSVLYVKDGCTVGIGTGEQDRVGVAEIAVFKAYVKFRDRLCFERFRTPYNEMRDQSVRESLDAETREKKAGMIGSVMVSDAFFPFRDGVEVGIREGISAVVHPGGSDRDYESIQACNEANPQVTMMFTNQRAFKH